MSVLTASLPIPLPHQDLHSARKRTSSFSYPSSSPFSPNPRPSKAQRTTEMATLCRSESMLFIPDASHSSTTTASFSMMTTNAPLPLCKTLQQYKTQRLRRKVPTSRITAEPLTICTRLDGYPPQPFAQQPQSQTPPPAVKPISATKFRKPTIATKPKRSGSNLIAPSQVILPSVSSPITTVKTPRTSSPLSPTRSVLPGRPVFPRSKVEPNLYKIAIKSHMRSTPEGQKILHMGPRLALSIMTATQELERIVADQQRDIDNDVVMSDSTFRSSVTSSLATPVLTTSWVMVRGDDWEMVDCAA